MARIAGVNIPTAKKIEVALTYIYGIGRNLAKTICEDAKVDPTKKAKDLDNEELSRLRDEVNIAQIMEIEEKYPNLKLVVAHIGRAYAKEDIGNAFEMSPPNSLKDRIANNIVSTTIITVVTFDKR